ncbi:MAG: hypothetical protein RL648_745 [Verrucomicrobiota bacterium]|jgi:hypothetical protein
MEDRKPRATRFEADQPEIRLARLREQAPDLGSNRRLRFIAIMGSVLVLLTVAAFGWTMRIYRAAVEPSRGPLLMQVEVAPEVLPDAIDAALERVEAEALEAEARYREELEALRAVDLLEDSATVGPSGEKDQ